MGMNTCSCNETQSHTQMFSFADMITLISVLSDYPPQRLRFSSSL